jgi:hypothetical protein
MQRSVQRTLDASVLMEQCGGALGLAHTSVELRAGPAQRFLWPFARFARCGL